MLKIICSQLQACLCYKFLVLYNRNHELWMIRLDCLSELGMADLAIFYFLGMSKTYSLQ
jgi:hypothetical protein